ncbi:MAG: hypothetical protein ACOY4F_15590 [Thermodesulfobacteriota bacterium]
MDTIGVRVGPGLAVSQYAGLAFSSLCRVGDAVLATGENGLFRLGGDTDDGAAVAAVVEFPPLKLGDGSPSRVREVRIRGDFMGGMAVDLAVDHGPDRRTAFGPLVGEGRVPVGRGGQGRMWRARLENVDGAMFVLDELGLTHVALDRR